MMSFGKFTKHGSMMRPTKKRKHGSTGRSSRVWDAEKESQLPSMRLNLSRTSVDHQVITRTGGGRIRVWKSFPKRGVLRPERSDPVQSIAGASSTSPGIAVRFTFLFGSLARRAGRSERRTERRSASSRLKFSKPAKSFGLREEGGDLGRRDRTAQVSSG